MKKKKDNILDDKFINFIIKCSDINNLEFNDFKEIKNGTSFFAVHAIAMEKNYLDYACRKYTILNFYEEEKYIELEDSSKNYLGVFSFDDTGNLVYSYNKITGKPNLYEKSFLHFSNAQKYMLNLNFICDITNDLFFLKVNNNL